MRGIIHLGDLHRYPSRSQHGLLDLLETPPTSRVTYSAYPPPQLIVVGANQSDLERLQPWLNECERLMQAESLEHLQPLLTGGERWEPEIPDPPMILPAEPVGDWWPLEVSDSVHPSELAAGIRGLELKWGERQYHLRDGESRPCAPDTLDFAQFPERNLAMRGGRCRFEWIWQWAGQECAVAENAHQWPAGHAKKLYGYQNNEPVLGQISQDGQVSLSLYQFDALLSSAPFPWREIQPGLVALVWPPQEAIHSAFYRKNFDYEDEEDERGGPPVLVLGPGEKQRYALALDRSLVRVDCNGNHHQLGGEALEYGLFDATHQRQVTRSGQLLGGNSRRLVIWDAGRLLAEDFSSGQRELFGFEKHQIEWSFPVQGGSNLLLIRLEENYAFLRLI